MKAVVAQRYGGPEALDLAQRPEPNVGPADVLIAVRAASLNPLDYKIRNGNVKLGLPLRPPIGLGCDVAGVVAGVGPHVSRFTTGKEVYARLEKMRMGGLAERVAADENVVALKPARASFAEAAAVPLAALTSLPSAARISGAEPRTARVDPGRRRRRRHVRDPDREVPRSMGRDDDEHEER
jgi:alcohol dehydrogenase